MQPNPGRDPHRPAPPAPGSETRARAHSSQPPAEGDEAEWHGITWRDVPGHDRATQKLNFSLLKRGLLRQHESCKKLHGEALKLKLHQLSDRNRRNSRKRKHVLEARKPPQPVSATTPGASLPPQSQPSSMPLASPWRQTPSATAWPEQRTPERSGPA